MTQQDPKFQKSKKKRQYDDKAGFFIDQEIERGKQIKELESILNESKDFLSKKDIGNIKRILSKLNKKLLEELKQALINKQMSKFRMTEVLHEDDELSG